MNKPKTSTQRVRRLRERLRAAGFVRHDVYVHPEDWPEIKRLVDSKMEKRTRGTDTGENE